MRKGRQTTNIMENNSPINIEELGKSFSELRDKLWRADKIKIQGYTYSEWRKTLSV